MTIIPEDGSGLTDANSYATVADATAYHSLRLNAEWLAVPPDAQAAALVRATDYIEITYASLCPRLTHAQALQWPGEATTAVPAAVVASTIMLALYALQSPLVRPIISRGITKQEKKLDGVGLTLTEFDASDADDPYPMVTNMLAGIATRKADTANTAFVRRLII